MSTTIPSRHTAGDTFSALLSGSTWPATEGWVAQLLLIGPARHTLASAADGPDHRVTATAAQTATWPPGSYATRLLYTRAATSDRNSTAGAALEVLPDPSDVGTTATALLSTAQRALADLEAAYRAHLASGSVHVGKYQIAGRSMEYRTLEDLLLAIAAARRDVAAEAASARVRAGLSPRIQYVTRM